MWKVWMGRLGAALAAASLNETITMQTISGGVSLSDDFHYQSNDPQQQQQQQQQQSQWLSSFWSFLAGASLVGCLWAVQTIWNLLPDEIMADDGSWIDPWNTLRDKSWKVIVENSEYYYYNHIGELPPQPKPRSHWPWETLGRRNVNTSPMQRSKQSSNSGNDAQDPTMNDRHDDHSTENSKSAASLEEDYDENTSKSPKNMQKEFCIGSIFGMDVGGTLSKLVYFEQKTMTGSRSSRQRHYAMAASAQSVLLARNSTSTNDIHFMDNHPTNFNPKKSISSKSKTSSMTGETHGSIHGKSPVPRRRSLSLGCLGRFKDLQKQMFADDDQGEHKQQSHTQHHPHQQQRQRQRSKHQDYQSMHSIDSQNDLYQLQYLRQESVPDDLSLFRGALHLEYSTDNSSGTKDPEKNNQENNDSSNIDSLSSSTGSNMKKSKSMFNLSHSQQKAVAMDRFYTFARRLDSYENSVRDHQLSFYSRELGGEFHFIHFESRWMNHAMDLIRYHNLHLNISKMGATGGGAHKYAQEWEEKLGIQMDKQEELDSLVAGMQFVLSTVVGECYTFRPHDEKQSKSASVSSSRSTSRSSSDSDSTGNDTDTDIPPTTQQPTSDQSHFIDSSRDDLQKNSEQVNSRTDTKEPQFQKTRNNQGKVDEWWWSRKVQRDAISYSKSYPYLLVTIGTGVSILRVDGPRQHERISGSTIGGGTYWGLIRLLTDIEDFEDVMRLAEKGDPAKVDMMVGDIYGNNSDALEKLGLPSHVVASSFGKLVSKEDPAAGLEQEDLARALLLMITNNIGQVAYLNAKLHETRRIFFVGNFLRNNTLSQRRLSYAIDYWSKGEMEALFLEHEGYFGSLGAFLMSQKIEQDDGGFFQWGESKKNTHVDKNQHGGVAGQRNTQSGFNTDMTSQDDSTVHASRPKPLSRHRRLTTFDT